MISRKGEFEGKVAIITGAAQGLGRAVANRLGREGAVLALVDVKSDKLQALAKEFSREGIKAKALVCDVSDQNQVHESVKTVLDEFDHIDILVNCAGVHYTARFHDMTTEEWDKVMNVNLRGTFLFMHEVYSHMKDRGFGRIVNFSSTAGLAVSNFGGAHYTASKHGVMGLTKAVAKEGARFGIRVNAICPGVIDTDMVHEAVDEERIKQYQTTIPLRRMGSPEEVAELVLFLASDRSEYITGVGINISGGNLI